MRRIFKSLIAGALSIGLFATGMPSLPSMAEGIPKPDGFKAAYERYGDVKVAKDQETGYQQLSDSNGEPVQLRGMSSFGLQWADGNWILNDSAFDALAYDWKCDIIRLAMYVTENGYVVDPKAGLARIEEGIRLATERGMYVLVDWHILSPGNPMADDYINAGVDLPEYAEIKKDHPEYTGPQLFFAYLSQKYGDHGNLLFETANEPNGNGGEDEAEEVWKTKLLPYHQSVVKAIREYDKDDKPNVVICGTDNWSQFVDAPVASPVVDPAVKDGKAEDNQIMYTFHFYSGTHDVKIDEKINDFWLRSKIKKALNGGIAVFCTEWGTSESTGDGGPYINLSKTWLDFLDEYKISWCSWSLALKNEISAAMKGKATKEPTDLDGDGIPNWDNTASLDNPDLSVTGLFVRSQIRREEAPLYGASEMITDFEDGLPIAAATGDGGTPDATAYPIAVGDLEGASKVLVLNPVEGGPWSAPRVSFQNLGNVYSLYTDITFDLYIKKDGVLVNDTLEIQPILQTPGNSYWGQLPQLTLTPADFKEDADTGLLKTTVKINFETIKIPEDKLGHITLMFGSHPGLYMDNLGLETWYNGDIHDAPIIPDKPGSFIGLPFTFENEQREGWKPEGTSMIDYNTISIEEVGENDHAMSFPVKLEVGKNEWEDGVRLSSAMGIFKLEDCLKYDAFAMDVYLEKGKATEGEIQLEICPIPNGATKDGSSYWYQAGTAVIDPVKGGKAVTTPGGRELQKYTVFVPLNSKDSDYGLYPMMDDVAVRNIIIALHGQDTDYEGRIYYDNIRLIDGENLDDIDQDENFAEHSKRILKAAASKTASKDQIVAALKTATDKRLTKKQFDKYGVTIEELLAKVKGYKNNDLTAKQIEALTKKLSDKKPEKKDDNQEGKQKKTQKPHWKHDENGWRYYDASGKYLKGGWKKVDGKLYYFDSKGYREHDCYRDGYWLGKNGLRDTKYSGGTWHRNSKGWWFEDKSGWYPVKQWVKVNGSVYFFNSKGYMESDCYRGGYYLNKSGARSTVYSGGKWYQNNKGWYYMDKTGWYPKNRTMMIDGKLNRFDAKGYWIEK